MSVRDHIGDLVSEKAFYKAVVILLGGLPAVEVITEIIVRFDNRFIPSFFLPQITGLFGIFGTFLTILYWLAAEPGKRKLRPADIFYFTLLFFMIISAVFSRHPGLYSYGDYFYCENPLHFLAYYWLYFAVLSFRHSTFSCLTVFTITPNILHTVLRRTVTTTEDCVLS